MLYVYILLYPQTFFVKISKQVDNLLHIVNISIIVLSMAKLFLRVYQIILKPFNCVSVFNVDESSTSDSMLFNVSIC